MASTAPSAADFDALAQQYGLNRQVVAEFLSVHPAETEAAFWAAVVAGEIITERVGATRGGGHESAPVL